MGVDRTDYIIYGYKMPADYLKKKGIDMWDDKFLRYIEGWKGENYSLIYDGMSGEYLVFGLRISMANEQEGFEFVELPATGWADKFLEVKGKTAEVFGFNDTHFAELGGGPKVLIFSHWH